MQKTISALIISGMLLCGAVAASALTPRNSLAETRPRVELGEGVPKSFGEWRLDKNQSVAILNPQTEAVLKSIYDGTLSRTYINAKGDRVMLSIAYGSAQTDTLKAHTPDICYPAQGFAIQAKSKGVLDTVYGDIPVNRLVTSLGQRQEPVTYWIVVGDEVGQGSLDRKLIQLKYGLRGVIPDGLLFRVSTISRQADEAFAVQEAFIRDLLPELGVDERKRMAGLQ